MGVHKPQLTKQDYQEIDEVFLAWSDREKPTWLKVVCAVMEKGKALAYWIAQEYGTFCCVFAFFSLSQYKWESSMKYTRNGCSRETNKQLQIF